jgi:hypothetical protein
MAGEADKSNNGVPDNGIQVCVRVRVALVVRVYMLIHPVSLSPPSGAGRGRTTAAPMPDTNQFDVMLYLCTMRIALRAWQDGNEVKMLEEYQTYANLTTQLVV